MENLTEPAFPSFSEKHVTFEKYADMSSDAINLIHKKANPELLPELLTQFWKEYGVGRFADGLLYICDPLQKKPTLDFFFPNQNLYPLVISSFGNIIYTDLTNIFYLSSIYGWIRQDALNFELLFEILLKRDDYLEGAFDQAFHIQCVKKLGHLEQDQIFGFEPAFALGGSDDNIDTVKKFQMDTHLAFLAQLVELEER